MEVANIYTGSFLVANVKALVPPRAAHQLLWNRTCNVHGGAGHNIPLDLHLDHMNCVFKDDINTFRANIKKHSATCSDNSVVPLTSLLESFDSQTLIKPPSGKHSEPSIQKDLNVILKCLQTEKVFKRHGTHSHQSFQGFSRDPIATFHNNPRKLHNWLRNKKDIATEHAINCMQL